jgi:hypothetical protein
VIFVTEDVGQHGELVALLDQAHGDAGHVRLHRHASVHQRQAAAADRSHRRRTVRFGDFRHHADRVGELVVLRQHRDQRALGQTAVADFTALRATHATRFAGGERRHVVVEHEAVAVFAGQRVDDLLVALGAERGHHQRLRFATGEQRRAVGARQHDERISIGRTVRVSRPSIRGSPARIWPRTIFASRSNRTLPTSTLSASTPASASWACTVA